MFGINERYRMQKTTQQPNNYKSLRRMNLPRFQISTVPVVMSMPVKLNCY